MSGGNPSVPCFTCHLGGHDGNTYIHTYLMHTYTHILIQFHRTPSGTIVGLWADRTTYIEDFQLRRLRPSHALSYEGFCTYVHTYIVYIYVHKGLGVAHLFPATCQNWLEKLLEFPSCESVGLPWFLAPGIFAPSTLAHLHTYVPTYIRTHIPGYICMYVRADGPPLGASTIYIRESMKCLLKPWFEAPSQKLRLSA